MTHASLFSGIGGPEVAAAMLGWKNAFHCEINPFGRAVLDYWFPESKSYEDITKTDFTEWRGRIDVLTGGFPCQPFSYAGKRGGREDERYLWPQMLRAIDEIRPTWVVGENVAGLATMVEAGVLTDLGGSPSLFDEGDDVHGYLLRETFTIERICSDLERLGYSVQPVLIPAAAVGAPHRRDRIFILAHDADAHRSDDERGAGADERESVCEGVQERDEVRLAGVADQLRSEVQGIIEDAFCDGPCIGEDDQQGHIGDERNAGAGNRKRVRGEEGVYASDSNCPGREEPIQSGREEDCPEDGAGLHDRVERPCGDATAADTDLQRFDERLDSSEPREEKRLDYQAYRDWRNSNRMDPDERWSSFPTVAPVHRGDDGLPFSLDDLTIPPTRWRFESLKAYGNAIVPQVMYRIFQAIEKA